MSDPEVATAEKQEPSAGRRMTVAAITISVFLTLAKFAGLLKEMLLVRYFARPGHENFAATDAFKVIYNSFVMLVYTKIEKLERPCYLPLFVQRKDKDGEAAAWEFGGIVMTIHFLTLVAIAVLGVLLAPGIVRTFWPALPAEGFRLAVLLLRMMAPALVAFSLSVMPELTLHSYKQFTVPALAEAAFRLLTLGVLVALVAMVWRPEHPNAIMAAGLGVVVGGAARLFVQLPSFGRRWRVPSVRGLFGRLLAEARALPWWIIRFPYKPFLWTGALALSVALTIGVAKTDWALVLLWLQYGLGIGAATALLYVVSKTLEKTSYGAALLRASEAADARRNPDMGRFWSLIPPVIVGLIYSSMRTYIDSYCATHIEVGAYSCLDYARRLPDTAAQILPLAVSFVVYPFLSEWAARGERDRLAEALVQTTRVIAYIFIPATIWMVLLRWGVLWFVYGDFAPAKQQLSILALIAYAPGMAFFSIEGILNHWYFAMGDTRTPNYVGSACAVLHVLMAVMAVFSLSLGPYTIVGVAAALTVSKAIKVLILYALLRGRVGTVDWKSVLAFGAKLLVACVILTAALHFSSAEILKHLALEGRKTAAIYLFAVTAIGVPIFLAASVGLRIEETWTVINHVKTRVLRRKR